jgi:hypothetical protein
LAFVSHVDSVVDVGVEDELNEFVHQLVDARKMRAFVGWEQPCMVAQRDIVCIEDEFVVAGTGKIVAVRHLTEAAVAAVGIVFVQGLDIAAVVVVVVLVVAVAVVVVTFEKIERGSNSF